MTRHARAVSRRSVTKVVYHFMGSVKASREMFGSFIARSREIGWMTQRSRGFYGRGAARAHNGLPPDERGRMGATNSVQTISVESRGEEEAVRARPRPRRIRPTSATPKTSRFISSRERPSRRHSPPYAPSSSVAERARLPLLRGDAPVERPRVPGGRHRRHRDHGRLLRVPPRAPRRGHRALSRQRPGLTTQSRHPPSVAPRRLARRHRAGPHTRASPTTHLFPAHDPHVQRPLRRAPSRPIRPPGPPGALSRRPRSSRLRRDAPNPNPNPKRPTNPSGFAADATRGAVGPSPTTRKSILIVPAILRARETPSALWISTGSLANSRKASRRTRTSPSLSARTTSTGTEKETRRTRTRRKRHDARSASAWHFSRTRSSPCYGKWTPDSPPVESPTRTGSGSGSGSGPPRARSGKGACPRRRRRSRRFP